MGFMKVNNPLELPDLGIWNFKSVIEELDDTGELAKAQFTFASDSSLYKNTDYKGIKGLESEGYGGTSISRIAEYMHQMYDEDHPEDKGGLSYKQYSNRTGLDKISDEMDFGTRIAQEDYDIFTDDYLTLTDAYKNDVDYYKLRAVTRFIQDDLGYDGIKYLNKGEDIGSQAWIIFNPNQFKSIFNKGTYQWGDRKKPHKNYMTKRKPNKYQNRKAVA